MAQETAATKTGRDHQRLRVGVLIGVHVYIVVHMLAWYVFDWSIWGKTAMLGVLSLLAGQLSAAAVMVFLIFVSMFFYGRFFCGWFCHLRGSIELADWVMRKLGIERYKRLRDKNLLLNTRFRWPFRAISMLILLLPIVFYWAAGNFEPNLDPEPIRPMADLPGYENALFAESAPVNMEIQFLPVDFLVAFAALLVILFVISFVFNLFYGQGAFCRVLCPYAAIFSGLVNVSPWQTKITRVGDCTGCRQCSQTCPQGIDVSREIHHYDGKVINRECIKCYRCVDSCEHDVLMDSRQPAVAQITPRKEYGRRPWLNPEKNVQVVEPLPLPVDLMSVLVGVICGGVASALGGFWFYVGAILGFVSFRQLASFWLARQAGMQAAAPTLSAPRAERRS
ncbi:MAG: 4Fe-4S binding protein [Deltaproteobacteria bacterium]|nr:4Fe-4S binding protein [Deltaproteobacteria bacterium]MBW2417442.1 4Fe-4S binding protein [Deltaproteobacteria bacterium]